MALNPSLPSNDAATVLRKPVFCSIAHVVPTSGEFPRGVCLTTGKQIGSQSKSAEQYGP